jgi:hypothetical protein
MNQITPEMSRVVGGAHLALARIADVDGSAIIGIAPLAVDVALLS